ncbi:hypothetical protein T484DRAFT_1859917 [Baffinella frigidus]|nr:hypothetical protein T484DRAFT_1859917 [Cryptophyta sp. CCMP2293]
MSHATDTASFHIFLWSYMVVAFFLLINILLAILVDAYASVKADTEGSEGIETELPAVVLQVIKSLIPGKHHSFISDQHLRKDEVMRNIMSRKAVLLSGGVEIDHELHTEEADTDSKAATEQDFLERSGAAHCDTVCRPPPVD